MTGRKSKYSRLLLLTAISAISATAFGSPSDFANSGFLWNEESSQVNHLRAIFYSEPNLMPIRSAGSSQTLESICASSIRLWSKELHSCPKFFYDRSFSDNSDALRYQLKSYLRAFPTTHGAKDWRNYFYLASTLVRLSDYDAASEIIERARESLTEQLQYDNVLANKLFAFSQLLVILRSSGENLNLRTRMLTEGQKSEQSTPVQLPEKLFSVIQNLGDDAKGISRIHSASVNHSEAIRTLVHEKWRVEQELDEVRVLLSRSRQARTDFDVIARTNLLAERFSIDSPEWLAIVNVAAKLKNRSVQVSRSSGMKSFLDTWLTEQLANKFSQKLNHDAFSVRANLVSQRLVPLILKVARKMQSNSVHLLSDDRLMAIVERLEAMQGSMHSFVDAVAFDSELSLANDIVRTVLNGRSTLLRVQARLTSYESLIENDSEQFQQLRAMGLEHRELNGSYENQLQKLTAQLHAFDPIVRANLRQTVRRIDQLRLTLSDLEKVSTVHAIGSSQSVFIDLGKFLSELSSAVKAAEKSKIEEAEVFIEQSEKFSEESINVLVEAEKFFAASASEINSVVEIVLRKIEAILVADREKCDLAIALHKSFIQQSLEGSAKRIESEIEKINSLKRIRQQNFEWRLSR